MVWSQEYLHSVAFLLAIIWNTSPLSAAHFICPGNSHQSSLLRSTSHHRQIQLGFVQTTRWTQRIYQQTSWPLHVSLRGTLTKPTSRRLCRTFISIYPVQPEDWIHSIIATPKNAYKAHSLPAFGKSDHAAIFLTPDYKQRIVQEQPVEREVTCWSSHSEGYTTGVSWWRRLGHVPGEFIWRQRIHGGSIKLRKHTNRTGHWNGNNKYFLKSEAVGGQNNLLTRLTIELPVQCRYSVRKHEWVQGILLHTLRRAVRAAKRRYRERIESHFQLNDSRRMWQGLKTICSSGNNSSVEVRADPLLAEELNIFYGRFECNGGATLPISAPGSSRRSAIM